MTIEKIIQLLKQKNPQADVDMVKLAYEFANQAHTGQKRADGQDYIQHPLEVAYKLAEMHIDDSIVIAGLLHDVPEDTQVTLAEIEKDFGEDIAHLVDGITKVGVIKYRGMERYAENLRKMFVAMAEDVRVVFIKFADRVHNLETLSALKPVKQQRIARESLEIYAPIANRLGMVELKGELEDLSFPFIYPEEYKWIRETTKRKIEEEKRFINKMIKIVKRELDKNSNVKIVGMSGRAKRYYSLYRKLLDKDLDIEKIRDLVAMRIIVNNVDDCYTALGYVHKLWKPVKGGIKDYIAQPKPNGYQSLHTAVFGPGGKIFEVQIRSLSMHEQAEWGVASHWAYKEKKKDGGPYVSGYKIKWIKELLDEQSNVTLPESYLENLKLDFFKKRIFVFTPHGDVVDLPEDATPIDFAYYIHTDLGHRCGGAKVNDKIVSLDTPLKSGDIVEIMTDKKRKGPTRDWLDIVKTHQAQNKIKGYFKKQRRLSILNLFNR